MILLKITVLFEKKILFKYMEFVQIIENDFRILMDIYETNNNIFWRKNRVIVFTVKFTFYYIRAELKFASTYDVNLTIKTMT